MNPTRRVAIGGIIHETHSFAEPKTTLADFQAQSLHYGDDILTAVSGTRAGIGGMIERANEYGWTLLPTAYGGALPAGVVEETAFQTILGELLTRLESFGDVDGCLNAERF